MSVRKTTTAVNAHPPSPPPVSRTRDTGGTGGGWSYDDPPKDR